MVALLGDLAVLQNKDEVCILNGGKTVRDDEAGTVLYQFIQRFLDLDLCAGIDIGGRFVEDQHRGIGKHRTGNGDELALTLGDIDALVGKDRIVTIGQMLDIGVDARCFRCRFYFLKRSIFFAVNDIFVDRAVEEPCVLQHHRVSTAQGIALDIADLRVFYENVAAVYVVETHEQVDDGGLTSTRGTNDRDGLTGLCVHGNLVKDCLFRGVAEGDVFKFHVAEDSFGERLCVCFVSGFGFFVDDAEHALCCGKCGLEFVEDVCKFIDGTCKFAGILHEFGNTAEGDEEHGILERSILKHRGEIAILRVHIEDTAEDHDKRDGEVIDEVYRRTERRAVIFRIVISIHGIFVAGVESAADFLLAVVCLNRAAAGDHFLRIAVQLTELAGALREKGAHFFGTIACKENGCGNGDDENEDHGLRDLPHEDERTDNGVKARHDLHKVVGKGGVYGVDVVRDAADDITCRMGIKVIDGKRGEFFKHLLTHAVNDSLAESDHEHGEQICRKCRGCIADEHLDDVFPDYGKIDTALCRDGIDGVAGKFRTEQGKLIGDERQRNSAKKEGPFFQHVADKTAKDLSCRFTIKFLTIHLIGVIIHSGVAKTSIQRWHLPSEIH